MPFRVGLDFELGQVIFGSMLIIVMQVNHRSSCIAYGGRAKYEPESVRQVHKARKHMCHKSHPLPCLKASERLTFDCQCPYFTPGLRKRTPAGNGSSLVWSNAWL